MAEGLHEGFACLGLVESPVEEKCELNSRDIDALRKFFPRDTEFLLPNNSMTADCVSDEWLAFPKYPFQIGWRNLLTLVWLSETLGVQVGLEELAFCYDLRSHGGKRFGFRVKTRANVLVTESIDKDRNWKSRFFYVKRSSLQDVEGFMSLWLTEASRLDDLFPKRPDTISVVEFVCSQPSAVRKFVRAQVDGGWEESEKGSSPLVQVEEVSVRTSSATVSQTGLRGVSDLIAKYSVVKAEDTKLVVPKTEKEAREEAVLKKDPAIPKVESSRPPLSIGDRVVFKKRKVIDVDDSESEMAVLGRKIQDAARVLIEDTGTMKLRSVELEDQLFLARKELASRAVETKGL